MTIGERIKFRREQLNMTQMELAAKLGFTSKGTISLYESGRRNIDSWKVVDFAKALDCDPGWLAFGDSGEAPIPSNAIPNTPSGLRPVLGRIPAGNPMLATEEIIGYEPVSVLDPEQTFWLRVVGDSMIGAGIHPGDYVLIRQQSWAENGQIVACRVNADEATLKRYSKQGNMILLSPENSAYDPKIIPIKDFETGDAGIIGVAIEFKRKLI